MAPPTAPLNLDVEAISGICGSISIAAWVVVFSPQIIENFRRGSADGLSLHFLLIWLAGDVFNVLGSVLQRVLPTMIILAVYYTLADIVLLGQVFSYRGFTLKDEVIPPTPKPTTPAITRRSATNTDTNAPSETTTLLNNSNSNGDHHSFPHRDRRGSDWSNLSPAVPMLHDEPATPPPRPTKLRAILWNATAIAMVCAAGIAGWFLSRRPESERPPSTPSKDELHFDFWGQIFGWLCAALYLGSRVPQLLLNWRRKSTEGVSILFFLFACLGNLTYVLSIMAYEPRCSHRTCKPGETGDLYAKYLLVNSSWLAGSFGTLLLDMGVFAQFFIYGEKPEEADVDDEETLLEDEEGRNIDESRWDQRPLLDRGDSEL